MNCKLYKPLKLAVLVCAPPKHKRRIYFQSLDSPKFNWICHTGQDLLHPWRVTHNTPNVPHMLCQHYQLFSAFYQLLCKRLLKPLHCWECNSKPHTCSNETKLMTASEVALHSATHGTGLPAGRDACANRTLSNSSSTPSLVMTHNPRTSPPRVSQGTDVHQK